MSRIFKNMVPYWKTILVIILLLLVQAWCDLSLPAYTSDIIDVGIQNNGIEHVLPEALTGQDYAMAQIFMTEEEKELWSSLYEQNGDIYERAETDEKQLEVRKDCSTVLFLPLS